MKYIITTLGCKVNQYETQAMDTLLRAAGHSPAGTGERADAVIINTCAVTAESGRKSRQAIRRMRDENPGAVLAVCGCYSQLAPDEAEELGAKVIFGASDRRKFLEAVERAVADGAAARETGRPFDRRVLERLPAGAVPGRTRAMLKVQDGCANFCAYCIIPYTRGRPRSMPLDQASAETVRLRDEGYMELVLTGIELASYGVDLPGRPELAELIGTVAAGAGQMRLRLGSLEPRVVTEDFCRAVSETGKVCRHFHLSLQSGCDRVLRNMNRKYDAARFYRSVELLRRYFPGCALTGDLITGFPGETEEDHAQTLEFIQKCGFSAMHVFPYSRRPGTPADSMPEQCDKAVKERRAREARAVSERMRRDFLERSVGLTLPVLFERSENGVSWGRSDTYLPVRAPGEGMRGRLARVRVTGADGEGLYGEMT